MARTVTILNGTASANWGGGIEVYSKGNITLTNIATNWNWRDGALIKNDYPGAIGRVTILSTLGKENTFNGNNGAGLTIWSNGAVAFKNVRSENNNLTERGIEKRTDRPGLLQ